MFQSLLRRSFTVFALAFILTSMAASAAPPSWGFGGELGRIWSALFGESGPRAGCEINPDGTTHCVPAPKAGCSIDPNGTTQCVPAPKGGCEIDPNGTPRCTP